MIFVPMVHTYYIHPLLKHYSTLDDNLTPGQLLINHAEVFVTSCMYRRPCQCTHQVFTYTHYQHIVVDRCITVVALVNVSLLPFVYNQVLVY